MSRLKHVILPVLCLFLLAGSARGYALNETSTNSVFSGGNASDYQPPTQNPQSYTATGFQSGSPDLQTPTGQGSAGQQNLPQTNSLEVAKNGQPASAADNKKPASFNPWPVIIALTLTITAVGYVLFQPDTSKKPKKPQPTPEPKAKAATKPKPSTKKPAKKPKKSSKKTTAKRKKKK